MAHFAIRQHRVLWLLHHFAVFVCYLPAAGNTAHLGEIRTGENMHHAGHVGRRAGVYAVQYPMGHIRAQEMHISLPTHIDVVCIISVSGQKPDVLAPFGTGADASICWHILILP